MSETLYSTKEAVEIVGGGLAGSEAAWQLISAGIPVVMHEMRPVRETPVHKTDALAELVCSNSLGNKNPQQAAGLLKSEMKRLGSIILQAAELAAVPAGQALAVDRNIFSSFITEKLTSSPLFTLKREEITQLPENRPAIIATGPMTSDALAASLSAVTGEAYLYFYDAVSPVISTDSLDPEHCFKGSRYNKGDAEYINCPLNREEYDLFLKELLAADRVEDRDYEQKFFESCLPVEEIASRGYDTLRFGPMKPVGLNHPETGEKYFAVVQLRQENKDATCYNIVGFQTRLKWPEQKRVFRLIPALRNAEFLRLGVMHRNIFINAPKFLSPTTEFKPIPNLFIAGQLSGVEGYMESTASGLIAGMNVARLMHGKSLLTFPPESALGALLNYIVSADPDSFQPMNINMGLFPPSGQKFKRKSDRNSFISSRAGTVFSKFLQDNDIFHGSLLKDY